MINPKYALVSVIEERMNITLTNEQLAYIFNNSKELIMTTPRGYGKNLITAIKIAIDLLLKDDYKIGVLCTNTTTMKLLRNEIKEILELLNANNQIKLCSKSPCRISMYNDSQVYLFSSDSDVRGHYLDEAYVIEFSHKQGINDAFNRMLMCVVLKEDYKINVIGTPTAYIAIEEILNRSNIKHIEIKTIEEALNSITIAEELPEFARPGDTVFITNTNEYYITNQYGEFVRFDIQ